MQKEAAVSALGVAHADKLQICIEVRTAPLLLECLHTSKASEKYKSQHNRAYLPCREMLHQGRKQMQRTRLRS